MISVVMPAFNANRFIAPAIESILRQSYCDFELIIVDDGSTDGTLETARKYAAQDNRVKIVCSAHIGNGGARNLGLAEAKYPWIAVMDADDIALPERLETLLRAAEADPEVIVWGSSAYHVGVDGRILSVFCVGPASKEEFLALRNSAQLIQVIHTTAMYRRDVALEIGGYDNRFVVATDAEFFDRMAAVGYFVALPEKLMMYRIHNTSLTMEKYRRQRLNARYVMDRQRRRLAHEAPIELAEFEDMLRRAPLWQRIRMLQLDMEDLFYRRGGMAYGQKQIIQACGYFMISVLINPFFAIPRIWKSTFSPTARKAIQLAKQNG
jgi:glycosyltransferase involved in cell wall biosynthesis